MVDRLTFCIATRTLSFDQAWQSITRATLLLSSDASTKFPRLAPGTITSALVVAPGGMLGRPQLAMILAPNGCFAERGEVFGDTVIATALLDRLLHHAIFVSLEGASYRLRGHADLQPGSRGSRHVPQHETPTRRRGRQPKIRTLRFTETTWATADMGSFRLVVSSNPSSALTVTLFAP